MLRFFFHISCNFFSWNNIYFFNMRYRILIINDRKINFFYIIQFFHWCRNFIILYCVTNFISIFFVIIFFISRIISIFIYRLYFFVFSGPVIFLDFFNFIIFSIRSTCPIGFTLTSSSIVVAAGFPMVIPV